MSCNRVESLIAPRFSSVTPGYFEAMGIDLSEGRYFEARDTLDAPGVVVIDERLAGRYWPDQSPVGRRMYQPSSIDDLLEITEDTRWFTVVGVVESVIFDDLTGDSNEAGAFYCPVAQAQARGMQFALKTTGNPPAVINSIRTALARIDPELPVFDGRTMRERLDLSLMSRRASMWLASAFAVVGLFLSAIGIYGILAYLVTQRSRDLGIRIALGSTSRQTFQLILREGLVLVSLGLTIGLGGAFALRRIIESQVYGVTPMDPILVSSVFTLVTTIAVAASLIPAFRATRLNPATLPQRKVEPETQCHPLQRWGQVTPFVARVGAFNLLPRKKSVLSPFFALRRTIRQQFQTDGVFMKLLILALIVGFAIAACSAPTPEEAVTPEPDIVALAREIHEATLTIDTHDDIPFNFATEEVDPGVRGDRKVDIPKMVDRRPRCRIFHRFRRPG